MRKLYIIAGEASGDLHGKNLLHELSRIRQNLTYKGVGGDGMKEMGMELTEHISNTNFMGFIEVVKNLGTIKKLFKKVKADVLEFQPDAIILIDYPGFNLRMAKFAHEHGIPVYYYISPQVWAWKSSRVKKIKAYVDKMIVILPFEASFYAKWNYKVDFVGHPLLDEIEKMSFSESDFRNSHKLGKDPVVAILPGSRSQEIRRMLPKMSAMQKRFPDYRFVIGAPAHQSQDLYTEILGDQNFPIIFGETYALLNTASAAIVTSGTATLETALFQVPEVVCYEGPWLSYQIAKRLVGKRIRFISLVNLIMDREIVKELIQGDFTEENLSKELELLLSNPVRSSKMREDYLELVQKLGDKGASARAAEVILAK